MMRRYTFVTVVFSFYLCFLRVTSVHIEDNAYNGISISVSENLKEQNFDFEKLKAVLTKSSEIIYHATKKRSYFGEFIISLPSSWNARMCTEFENKAFQKVDIYLTNSNGESSLRAKHSKGCGEEGDMIYMPHSWLYGKTAELAHQFAQQWSIYRYGVFEEEPVKDGLCHLSENSWAPVGCYNIKSDSEPTFKDGIPLCSLPNDFFEQNELQSSLMSLSNSSNILHFCDGTSLFPHNPTMPTLHNNLCKGKTVWSVIENSKDFKHGRNLPLSDKTPPAKPKFKCFREKPVQVTFAIQNDTVKTDLSKAMIQMGSSLYEFLSSVAPRDSAINVVMFSDSNDTSKPLRLDVTDAKKLSEALEYHVKTFRRISEVCLSCGFQKALDATTDYSPAPIVILIAWESALIGEKPSVLIEGIRRYPKNIRLHLVLVEDTEVEVVPTDMIQVVRSLGGLIYSLPNELVFMASKLQLILSNIIKNPFQLEDRILIVHEANYHNISENFIDSFITPPGGFEKMVYFMYCDPNRNSVIRSDNMNCTSLGRPTTEVGAFKCGEIKDFTDEKVPMKNWQYSFSYLVSTVPVHCSSVAMLLTLASISSTDSFAMRGWLSNYVVSIPENVLIIYVEIIGSSKKFKVHAQISGPGLPSPIIIELRDNGNGDPDVKANDGIYSRYFTSFSKKGTYTVSVSAELQKEASEISFFAGNQALDSSPSQKKDIGFFYVNRPSPDIDILPPSRIADLNVVSVNHENRRIQLQWTAPGNDYDFGQAKKYEIYFTEDWKDLQDSMLTTIQSKMLEYEETPKQSGEREVGTFQFPEQSKNTTYYVALRAADVSENKGQLSNMIQIVIGFEKDPTPNITGGNITGNGTETSTESIKIALEVDDYSKCYVIIGGLLGVILFILIINIIIWATCFRKYKKRRKESQISNHEKMVPEKIISDSDQIALNDQLTNHRSYANPAMDEYSATHEVNEIHSNASSPGPSVTYAKVIKRDQRSNDAYPMRIVSNTNLKPEYSTHKESDLGLI